MNHKNHFSAADKQLWLNVRLVRFGLDKQHQSAVFCEPSLLRLLAPAKHGGKLCRVADESVTVYFPRLMLEDHEIAEKSMFIIAMTVL
jgi:hypothetical protein